MPLLDCDLTRSVQALVRPPSCLKKVYVSSLAISRLSDIDGVADTDGQISAFTMGAGVSFVPVDVGRRQAKISWEYTSETGLYSTQLEIDLGGFDHDNRQALLMMQGFCDLVVYASLSDCNRMILGMDNIDGAWDIFDENTLSGHSASLGGDEDGSNIITFTFNTLSSPEIVHSTFTIPPPLS